MAAYDEVTSTQGSKQVRFVFIATILTFAGCGDNGQSILLIMNPLVFTLANHSELPSTVIPAILWSRFFHVMAPPSFSTTQINLRSIRTCILQAASTTRHFNTAVSSEA